MKYFENILFCDFGGWFDNANCSGSAITSITTTDWGDKVFYAKWIPKSYSVTLNPTSGTIKSGNVTTYTYGTGAILPTATNMERTGYVFAGWYDNESCSGEVVNAISVTDFGSKEFWAAWEEGAVAELIQVDAKYSQAIETALGAASQHIVTETEQHAQKAIGWLKQKRAGRATFLPKTVMRSRNIPRRVASKTESFTSTFRTTSGSFFFTHASFDAVKLPGELRRCSMHLS